MAHYLDPDDQTIYLGSVLYSASTAAHEFEEIAKFLTKNPTEIVIIDLNGDWLHTIETNPFNFKVNSEKPDYDFYIALDNLLDHRFLMVFVIFLTFLKLWPNVV